MNFPCSYCGEVFTDRGLWAVHVDRKHGTDAPSIAPQPRGYERADAYKRLGQQLAGWATKPDSRLVSIMLGDLRQVMDDAEVKTTQAQ